MLLLTKKSLNPNDKGKTKQKKKAKPFPSVKPLPIPHSKNTPTSADKLQQLKQVDFIKQMDDFAAKQQAVQPIGTQKPI